MSRAGLIVDHQAHWYPPTYLESILDRDGFPRAVRAEGGFVFESQVAEASALGATFFDLDVQIADMDAHGIDVAVISPNLIGEVSRLPVEEAVATLELLNGELSRAQRDHPDRIVGLAMLPMQDADAAIQVLDRAIGERGLKGVCVLSNIAGRPIVGDGLLTVYRRIEELGVPLFLHPSHVSVAQEAVLGPTIEIGLAWMFDTAAAALALIYGGVLDACPDLTVVHPHLGGTLPYVTGRVIEDEIGVDIEHDLLWYLRERFYVDSVQKTAGAIRLAAETYGPDRIVYGTDFPWIDRASGRAYVEDNLDSGELEAVLRTNAVPNLDLPAR